MVATPIGNLEDLSPRAARELSEADVIACEDTRRTRRLLSHAGITGQELLAVHDHNEAAQARRVLALVESGSRVALVADAGTPGISDPGQRVASAVAAAGGQLRVVPGPSAATAALVVSGLATGRWCFEGFIPRRGSERGARLDAVAAERRTTVIFEAPHRLASTLSELARRCGAARQVAVARELTKLHEEVWRASLGEAVERVSAHEPRGEHVVVLAGAPAPDEPSDEELDRAVAAGLGAGGATRQVADAVAVALNVSRRRAYQAALRLKGASGPEADAPLRHTGLGQPDLEHRDGIAEGD